MQRHALSLLFAVIALALVVIAVAAILGDRHRASGWIVALAALAVAGWLGSLALSGLRR